MYLLGGIMYICIEYMYVCPSLSGMIIPNGFKILRFSSVLKSTKGYCTVLYDKKYQVSLFLQMLCFVHCHVEFRESVTARQTEHVKLCFLHVFF